MITRYLALYGALWKNSVSREMGFKVNFFLWIVVELLWFALQLLFMVVVYQHTESIGDWTKWDVVLLVGASHFIQQIYQAFFLTNVTQISEHVRTGKLAWRFHTVPIAGDPEAGTWAGDSWKTGGGDTWLTGSSSLRLT